LAARFAGWEVFQSSHDITSFDDNSELFIVGYKTRSRSMFEEIKNV